MKLSRKLEAFHFFFEYSLRDQMKLKKKYANEKINYISNNFWTSNEKSSKKIKNLK